jgi:hypothetical protein
MGSKPTGIRTEPTEKVFSVGEPSEKSDSNSSTGKWFFACRLADRSYIPDGSFCRWPPVKLNFVRFVHARFTLLDDPLRYRALGRIETIFKA